MATGRHSNLDLLGPDHGLETDERGFVTIGPRYETSLPGVWALGDVNGHGAFTHTAYQDSEILLNPPRTVTGRVTTYAMFTDPPLGRVGMSTAEAKASGRRVLKAEVPMSSVSRAKLEGETERADAGAGRRRQRGDPRRDDPRDAGRRRGADRRPGDPGGIRYPALRDVLPIHPTVAEFLPSILGSLTPLE